MNTTRNSDHMKGIASIALCSSFLLTGPAIGTDACWLHNTKKAQLSLRLLMDWQSTNQATSLAAILATWAPWYFAASSSISEG
jgi:hypothetical protein